MMKKGARINLIIPSRTTPPSQKDEEKKTKKKKTKEMKSLMYIRVLEQ